MRLTLYKRGRIWWVSGPRKFRKSTEETSQKAADLVRRRWEIELADPEHHRASTATVASAAERWMMEITSAQNPETVRFYKYKIGHVVRVLGAVRLAKLTHEKVLAYVQQREGAGEEAHKHSIHRELTALRLTLKSAQRAGEFPRDPKSVIPRYSTGYVPGKHWVTRETVWRAIKALPEYRGRAVAFVMATAADFGCIFTAELVDVRARSVHVRGTKTSTRSREVPRVGVFDEFLRYAIEGAPQVGPMFAAWGKMARDVRAACRRAKVPEFTARTLRRSAATWMVNAGVPYEVAAKFLGHGSVAMLMKVYGQLAPADAGRLIDEKMSVSDLYTPPTKEAETEDAAEPGNTGKPEVDDES